MPVSHHQPSPVSSHSHGTAINSRRASSNPEQDRNQPGQRTQTTTRDVDKQSMWQSGLEERAAQSYRRSKLCCPGLSLTYTAHPPTARADACRAAASCWLWNMSQSGWGQHRRSAPASRQSTTVFLCPAHGMMEQRRQMREGGASTSVGTFGGSFAGSSPGRSRREAARCRPR